MRFLTKHERRVFADKVDRLLRLPDFSWENHGISHIVGRDNWRVWIGLGAFTCKSQPATHRKFIRHRLKLIFETFLNVQARQKDLKVNTPAFFEAVHKAVSDIEQDVTDNISPADLGHLVATYSAALRSAKLYGNVADDEEEEEDDDISAKLRGSVTEWLDVLLTLREDKRADMLKRHKEFRADILKRHTEYLIKAKDESDNENEDMDLDNDSSISQRPVSLTDRPGAVPDPDFHPQRLPGEYLEEYVARLQQKIRELRTKVVREMAIVQARDEKIENQNWRIEELKELADGGDNDDDDEMESDRPRAAPPSPWVFM